MLVLCVTYFQDMTDLSFGNVPCVHRHAMVSDHFILVSYAVIWQAGIGYLLTEEYDDRETDPKYLVGILIFM